MNHFSCYVSILRQNKEFLFPNTNRACELSMIRVASLSFKPTGKVSASSVATDVPNIGGIQHLSGYLKPPSYRYSI